MSHVVITGGAGFLGSHLAQRALADGWDVTVLDDLSSGSTDNLRGIPVRFITADVADRHWLPTVVPTKPDLFLHLASPASPPAYQRDPLGTLLASSTGLMHVLDAALFADARVVFASTSEVYGDPAVHPQVEDYHGNVSPDGPRSMYDEAKRFGEALCAAYRSPAYSLSVGVVRIFNTYGPRMHEADGRVVSNFITQAQRGEPLTMYGDGMQTRSLCYVTDTVEALWAYALTDHTVPVNIGNPEEVSMIELAEVIARAVTGDHASIEWHPPAPDDPTRRCPDIRRAKELLGWSPTIPLAEGIRMTLQEGLRTT